MERSRALRFSIRFLLLVTVAFACAAWWLAIPSLKARRFAEALNRADWQHADGLCRSDAPPFPGSRAESKGFQPHASLMPLSWNDLLAGRRKVVVAIATHYDDGIVTSGVDCVATRQGIEVGLEVP